MELRHIRYFIAAADELHFGRASDLLAVTRPAVSKTIADLETELGVRLFRRHTHKVALTAAGETFLKHARTVMQDVDTAVTTTRRVGQGKLGLLTVGYGSLGLRHPLFREAVKQMGARYPQTDLVLQEMVSSQQIEAVRAGKLDAGFVYLGREGTEVARTLPGRESVNDLQSVMIEMGGLGVAVPRDHPLADAKGLDLSQLTQEGFILVGTSIVNPYFNFVPNVVQEVSNIATQINLISVGMGVGLVVTSPNLRYGDDIRVIPLRGVPVVSEFRLVWRPGDAEPIQMNFVEIVQNLAAQAMSQR